MGVLNQVILVGRLEKIENSGITLKIGDIENREKLDYISVDVSKGILDNIKESCEIDCILGVKGKIANKNKIIANKVSFLSNK